MATRVELHIILLLISLAILIAAVFHKWISFRTNNTFIEVIPLESFSVCFLTIIDDVLSLLSVCYLLICCFGCSDSQLLFMPFAILL